jgi:DNA-binding transcriptional regulator YhcF (GntR family)
VHSVSADHSDTVYERLIDAVLDQIRDAAPGELLRSVTDRELARKVGVSAGTVRRTFARTPGTEQLGRDRIFVAVVERVLADLDAAHQATAARWTETARHYAAGGGTASVVDTVGEVLGRFIPTGDARIDARERVYRLAMAVADGDDPVSREIALLLRRHLEYRHDCYREAYRAMMDALGVRLADGVELDEFIDALDATMSMLVERARIGILVEPEEALRLLTRAVSSFVRPADDPGPDEEPIGGLFTTRAASSGDGAGQD